MGTLNNENVPLNAYLQISPPSSAAGEENQEEIVASRFPILGGTLIPRQDRSKNQTITKGYEYATK